MPRSVLCVILGVMLLFTAAFALEYETDITDNKVLAVRLAMDDASDGSWDFEISNPAAIDMLTNEESNGQFAISFYATGGEASGDSLITFKYKDKSGYVADEVVLRVYADEGEVYLEGGDSFCAHDGELTVNLDSNPTTGYQWTYEVEGDLSLELVSEDYTVDVSGMAGSGGVDTKVFKPGSDAGSAVLTFKYARSWEDVEPARTVILDVSINADGILEFALRP